MNYPEEASEPHKFFAVPILLLASYLWLSLGLLDACLSLIVRCTLSHSLRSCFGSSDKGTRTLAKEQKMLAEDAD